MHFVAEPAIHVPPYASHVTDRNQVTGLVHHYRGLALELDATVLELEVELAEERDHATTDIVVRGTAQRGSERQSEIYEMQATWLLHEGSWLIQGVEFTSTIRRP